MYYKQPLCVKVREIYNFEMSSMVSECFNVTLKKLPSPDKGLFLIEKMKYKEKKIYPFRKIHSHITKPAYI